MRVWNRIQICVGGFALLIAALMLLVLPVHWLMAAVVAAVWHECCHAAAVILCGGRIRRVCIGLGGMVMESDPMSSGREVVCSLAGPLGSFLLLLLMKWIPRTAVCACIHGVYNLLPVYPLDGGRALATAAYAILPVEQAERACACFDRAVIIVVLAVAVYSAIVLRLGMVPIILCAFLLFGVKKEKLLANCRNKGYNRPTIVKR